MNAPRHLHLRLGQDSVGRSTIVLEMPNGDAKQIGVALAMSQDRSDQGGGDSILAALRTIARRANAYNRGRRDERATAFHGERRSVRRRARYITARQWARKDGVTIEQAKTLKPTDPMCVYRVLDEKGFHGWPDELMTRST